MSVYFSEHCVSLENVLKFCFPSNFQHPHSAVRLFLLAKLGPCYETHTYFSCLCTDCKTKCRKRVESDELCKQFYAGKEFAPNDLLEFTWLCKACEFHCQNIVHLRGGFKGQHIVSDQELQQMELASIREDIVSLYMPNNTMTLKELNEAMFQLPSRLRNQHDYTPDELIELIKEVPRFHNGEIDFHKFASRVEEIRLERLKQARKVYPDIVKSKPKPSLSALSLTTSKSATAIKSVAPTTMKSTLTLSQAYGHQGPITMKEITNKMLQTTTAKLAASLNLSSSKSMSNFQSKK